MGFFGPSKYNIDTICLNCGSFQFFHGVQEVGKLITKEIMDEIECDRCKCKGFCIIRGKEPSSNTSTGGAAAIVMYGAVASMY